ncbi:copper resistance protein CopC [Streptomyces canus]|uniref:copper resistance CopC/CopD family protein n=1 Tax=Streptomyces canus TaxID=58343 RepID=UPI00224DC792|nr:copper resistance protein CopC [Streptomyces canus]MCX4854953.1 copper resistance protein CopC [Streptomyces canus]WSW39648.1 copper resistance protein CopC [Streptomyces canus]
MERRRTERHGRVTRALLIVVALLAGALLGGAAPASAHAVLTSSDPRGGTVLKTAPKQVTVSFDESVALAEDSVRVLDPDGRPVTAGDPTHADGAADTARVPLTGGLQEGTYTVSWRVLSADSHAVSGAFTFSVGAPSTTRAEAAAEPAVDRVVDLLYGIGRYVAYGGLALLIGVAVFVVVCRPGSAAARVARAPLRAGWWALTLSTVALLLLRGPYVSGDGPGGTFDLRLLRDAAGSRPGIALLVRLALLLLVGLLAKRGPSEWRTDRRSTAVGLVLVLGLAGTWAAAEHASAGIQVPVAIVSSVLHLLAMAVWLGGLTALLLVLYRAPADEPLPSAAVSRFSRLALASVAVLAATGVYQSWRGLGSWEAFATSYGRLLVLKIGAVVLMVMAASYSRSWTERLRTVPREEPVLVAVGGDDQSPPPGPVSGGPGAGEAGSEAHRRGLRRSVLAEVVIGVLVLAVTTVLTGSQPGRAAVESAAAETVSRVPGQPDVTLTLIPFDTGSPGGRGKVQVTLEPGRVGRNVVEAVIFAADGSLVAIPELRLTFTQSARGVGPLDARLADQRGYWGSDTLDLPLAGTWTIRATVRVSDIDQVTVSKNVKINP